MSVRAGREFLSIPGPTVIPDAVLAAMQRPAVDIYSGPLVALTDGLLADVSKMFRTQGRSYIYAANGHGAWEAALTNVLSRGDKVLVLESGRFAIGWGEAARMLGAEVEVLPGDFRRAVRPEAVEARLKADAKGEIKALLVAQIDTASGVINDIAAISAAIRAAGHGALLMVDVVAALGCVPFEMDDWGVDVAMSGSQKGLMTPPGLGFVAAGKRAREAHHKAGMRTPYWDWTFRDGELHYHKYCGTPPEHLLFALRAALDMLFAEGMEAVFHRHRLLAEATRRAVGTWAEGQAIAFNVSEPEERSDTVTAIVTRNGESAQPLADYCRDKCGVVLGRALGQAEGKGFRIAHMGHVNAPMILGTLSVVEMAMAALGMPHGRGGAQAAVEFLAKSVPA
ncbi:MAG: alanine-glyoxylate transaminase / serine-glyoxylate transaminase / serine-pyruvate transaminase [Hyphomicrobiales bacterium]|jgi:alanine-glyoxylate transaminase/serine-glyoxylate transaminase/serine-pyruvate transaminase|nr:alanine-glyoxylate transaminase / serine-glyoxylate transaminase / serine-pyruvate transaminase [Hyphomicrobiales bacterium]